MSEKGIDDFNHPKSKSSLPLKITEITSIYQYAAKKDTRIISII